MTSIAMALSDPNRYSVNWIQGKAPDLLIYIGGALTGYLMMFFHAGLQLDMITVWFIWVAFIDTPHFFGTYVRTYFDKEEFKARKPLLLGSLAWLFVGPALIGISYLMYQLGFSGYNTIFYVYVLFFSLWAYWHVVRQHWGILALYKKKNKDFDAWDTRIDKYLLYGGLLAPFAAFIVRHPEARQVVGLSGAFPAYPQGNIFSMSYLSQLHWEHGIVGISVLFMIVIGVFFITRQVQRARMGMPINLPKLLFFVALIPLYAFINYSSAILTAPLIAFSAFVTIYHDVQYHGIVWFYSKNRYHHPDAEKKYGMAVKISRTFITYALSAIAMGLILRFLGCAFEIHPGCGPFIHTGSSTLFGEITTKELLYSIIIGIPLHHYFVDQYIWRPSKDKALQQDLKLNK
jgi:hypothetical protein